MTRSTPCRPMYSRRPSSHGDSWRPSLHKSPPHRTLIPYSAPVTIFLRVWLMSAACVSLFSSCAAPPEEVESAARALGYESNCRNIGANIHFCSIEDVPSMEHFETRVRNVSENKADWKGFVYKREGEIVFEFNTKYDSICYSGNRYESGIWIYTVSNGPCGSPSTSDYKEVPVPWQIN